MDQPTKEELAVAKHLRFNVPCREGKLNGSFPVKCFVGKIKITSQPSQPEMRIIFSAFLASKAIDCMLDSKWATNKGKTDALFTTRASCVDYCNQCVPFTLPLFFRLCLLLPLNLILSCHTSVTMLILLVLF